MQGNLFDQELKHEARYGVMLSGIKYCAKLTKFLDCRLRKLAYDREVELPTIFKAIRDVQHVGGLIYTLNKEMSSPRPLKIGEGDSSFVSALPTNRLVLETSKKLCLESVAELKAQLRNYSQIFTSISGKSKSNYLSEREEQIDKRLKEFYELLVDIKYLIIDEIDSDI